MSAARSTEAEARVAIRDLAEADLPRVAEFEAEIARQSFQDEAVTDLDHYRRKLGKLIGSAKDWAKVLEADGEVIGWAWVSPRQNFVTGDAYADFRSFFVDRRRAGATDAVRLLDAVVRHCRAAGLHRIVGRTAADNERMRALYDLAGFREMHVVYALDLDAETGLGRAARR